MNDVGIASSNDAELDQVTSHDGLTPELRRLPVEPGWCLSKVRNF